MTVTTVLFSKGLTLFSGSAQGFTKWIFPRIILCSGFLGQK
jgi:hypothetical protein